MAMEGICRYKLQVIIGLILLASIFVFYKFVDKQIENSSTYLISIALGLIAFSIPFLWNAYQRILDKKAHIQGDKIKDILTKEFYQKSLKRFKYFIQYPVGVLIFLGLFVVPLLPFHLGGAVLVLFLFYLLTLPQIFDAIERSSITNLTVFLEDTNVGFEDTRKVFKELWQEKDDSFEKKLSIEPVHVFKCFTNKVDNLIKENKSASIYTLIKDFKDFLQNRSNFFLTVYEEVHTKILEWHFKAWKCKYEYSHKTDGLKEVASYGSILRMLESIIESTEKQVLKGKMSFSFFECFKKHVEKYKEEKIEDKNKRTRCYIESLFCTFYQAFFENIKDAPEKYDIWEYYFPKEWKITKANLENKDDCVSEISLDQFLRWAYPRIQQPTADYDGILEDAIKNLFPEVSPIEWSRILLFVYTPHDPNSRVKSVIEREWNFGFTGRGYVSFIGDKKEVEKEFNADIQQQERKAFELALFLFVNQFEKESLKRYVEELKGLKYDNESKGEGHRLRLLDIFEKMLNLRDSKR